MHNFFEGLESGADQFFKRPPKKKEEPKEEPTPEVVDYDELALKLCPAEEGTGEHQPGVEERLAEAEELRESGEDAEAAAAEKEAGIIPHNPPEIEEALPK